MRSDLETCAAGDPAIVCAMVCRWFADNRPDTFKVDGYDCKTSVGSYGSTVLQAVDANGEEVGWIDTGVMP